MHKKVIKCKTRYLSEDETVEEEVKKFILTPRENGRIGLIQAYTGTGKTHLMFDILKKNNIQFIYVLPNIATTDNIAKSTKILPVNSKHPKNPFCKLLEQGKSIVTTVDQLTNIEKLGTKTIQRLILILDEAHYYPSISGFRRNAINGLIKAIDEPFLNVLMVTATIGSLEHLRSPELEVLKIETPFYTKYRYLSNSSIAEGDIDKIKEYVSKLDGQVIMYSNTSKLDNKIVAENTEGWYHLSADTPYNDELRKSVIEHQTIPDYVKVLVATDIFTAGLNITRSNVKHCVLNNVHDPTTLQQFVARIRNKKELDVHYFKGTLAPAFNPRSEDDGEFIVSAYDLFLKDAMRDLERLKIKFEREPEYVYKNASEFNMVDYIFDKNRKPKVSGINYFSLINNVNKHYLGESGYYDVLKYIANLDDLTTSEIRKVVRDNPETFIDTDIVKLDDAPLKELKKEVKEELKQDKEVAINKVGKAIETHLEKLIVNKAFDYVSKKEGLSPSETKLMIDLFRRIEKYTINNVPLFINVLTDEKYYKRLYYQAIPKNIAGILEFENILIRVKRKMVVGDKIPKTDYRLRKERARKEMINAIWKYNDDGIITGRRTDWKELTTEQRRELKKLFFISKK